MSYQLAVAAVARAHREEIESDLQLALREHGRLVAEERRLAGTVATLESLLASIELGVERPMTASAAMTLHEAMREVLESAPMQMMRATDLARVINQRRLYRMRDGRPVEPQQIHARTGNYEHMFEREGTFIKLRHK